MSGKTTLAKKIVKRKCELTDRPLLVLDPNLDPDWDADFMTDDPMKYKDVVKANKGCELVIDEAGEMLGRYAKDMGFLGTRSRHYGHVATFITQRAQSLDRNVRDQCSRFFIFSIARSDCKIFAEDLVDDELLNAYDLAQGEYYAKMKFKKAVKLNAFE